MAKFIKNIDLPPIILYRNDIIKLIETLATSSEEPISLEVIISNKEIDVSLTSIKELDNYIQSKDVNRIQIIVSYYHKTKEEKSHDYISLDLNKYSAKFYISSDDQIWLFGKISQIKDFFIIFKKWHSPIRRISFPLLMIFCGFLFGATKIFSENINIYFLFTSSIILLILSLISMMLNVIIPYSQIYIKDKKSKISYEGKMLFITLLALIIALASLIVNIMK